MKLGTEVDEVPGWGDHMGCWPTWPEDVQLQSLWYLLVVLPAERIVQAHFSSSMSARITAHSAVGSVLAAQATGRIGLGTMAPV